jgi:hypothetical protein
MGGIFHEIKKIIKGIAHYMAVSNGVYDWIPAHLMRIVRVRPNARCYVVPILQESGGFGRAIGGALRG